VSNAGAVDPAAPELSQCVFSAWPQNVTELILSELAEGLGGKEVAVGEGLADQAVRGDVPS